MEVVYWLEKFPELCRKSIFLAGPTAGEGKFSWRTDAIEMFRQLGFDGHLFVPEPRGFDWPKAEFHDAIVDWEVDGLNRADCILFWVPRNMETMPGLTTNIEFGEWFKSGKVVLGCPVDAPKMDYMKYRGSQHGIKPIWNSLEQTISWAITKVGASSTRMDGECMVPGYIWHTKAFMLWYLRIKESGYKLNHATISWVDHTDQIFARHFALKATVQRKGSQTTEEMIVIGHANGGYEAFCYSQEVDYQFAWHPSASF
jgi:hypothetical protein